MEGVSPWQQTTHVWQSLAHDKATMHKRRMPRYAGLKKEAEERGWDDKQLTPVLVTALMSAPR